MFFSLEGFSILKAFNTFTETFFCKKRRREENDPNLNYLFKKRSQTSHYFDDYNKTSTENFRFTNTSHRNSFQNVTTIRNTLKRRSRSLDKSSCLSVKESNHEQDKFNFNDQILKDAFVTINTHIGEIKEEKKVVEEEKPSNQKKNFKFKVKMIKNEANRNEDPCNVPIYFNYKKDFSKYQHLIEYVVNKNPKSFPTIDEESFNKFQKYLIYQDEKEIVIPSSVNMHQTSLLTLKGMNWLNDEILNSYVELLTLRRKVNEKPRFYIFNTFFYQALEREMNEKSYNFAKYKKRFEKKKLNFLDYKSILFPINFNNNHWVLAVVDLKNKKLSYYDSLLFYSQAYASQILSNLSKFFDDFLASKSGDNHKFNLIGDLTTDRVDEDTTNTNKVDKSFKTKEKSICSNFSNNDDNISEIHNDKFFTGWKQYFPDCPKQTNSSDCGVFVCKFMDYITRDIKFDFSQNDMEYFRILIGVELIKGTVLTV